MDPWIHGSPVLGQASLGAVTELAPLDSPLALDPASERLPGQARATAAAPMSASRSCLAFCLLSCTAALLTPLPAARRRAVLRDATALVLLPLAANADSPPPMESVDVAAYKRIPGGGRYADLAEGKGTEIGEGSKVSLQWVLRRSNGYYVDGSVKMLSARSGAVAVDSNFDEERNFIFTVCSPYRPCMRTLLVRGLRACGLSPARNWSSPGGRRPGDARRRCRRAWDAPGRQAAARAAREGGVHATHRQEPGPAARWVRAAPADRARAAAGRPYQLLLL